LSVVCYIALSVALSVVTSYATIFYSMHMLFLFIFLVGEVACPLRWLVHGSYFEPEFVNYSLSVDEGPE